MNRYAVAILAIVAAVLLALHVQAEPQRSARSAARIAVGRIDLVDAQGFVRLSLDAGDPTTPARVVFYDAQGNVARTLTAAEPVPAPAAAPAVLVEGATAAVCPSCNGRGSARCSLCFGTGHSSTNPGLRGCIGCEGTGDETCSRCQGTGTVQPPPGLR